jgi:membrane-bound metal-dependent hydrolase YbcI (DUF457 family)
MANYKGHTIGGIAACLVYIAGLSLAPWNLLSETAGILSDWQMSVGLFLVAFLFALFPDIDTNSKGQNIFFGAALIADIALIATGRIEASAYLGLLAMAPIVGKHRGWTHTKWAMILVPSPILIIPYLNNEYILPTTFLFYGAAVAGYFSHLLLDGRIIRSFRVRGGYGG